MSALPLLPEDVATVYDRTAPHYELIKRRDDYVAWIDLVDRLIREAGAPGARLLDVGCGTGHSAVHLRRHGYRVSGLDASPAMVEIARQRTDTMGVDFHVGDMRVRFADAAYDIVNCTSDVINYLLDPADVVRSCRAFADALRPGGLVLFDVNTLHGYRLAIGEPEVIEEDGRLVLWRGRRTGAGSDRYELLLDVFHSADGLSWRRETIAHEQAHHGWSALHGALSGAGLTPVGVYAMGRRGELRRVDAEPDDVPKLIYVARREPAGGAGS